MITAERATNIKFKIFATSKDLMDDTYHKIQEDLVEVIRSYEKKNDGNLQVHLSADFYCGHCGHKWPDCTCGKPHKRPAV